MTKKLLLFLLVILIIIVAIYLIFPNNWSYKLEGYSENWKVKIIVEPIGDYNNYFNQDSDVVLVGYIEKLNDRTINHIFYEVDLPWGGRAGNIDKPNFSNGEIKLFTEFPNYKIENDKGQISNLFTDAKYMIVWNDEDGEHTEEIYLELKD